MKREELFNDMKGAFLSIDSARIADVFAGYYSKEKVGRIKELLAGGMTMRNLDDIAHYFANINPYYSESDIKRIGRSVFFVGKNAALIRASEYLSEGIIKQFSEKF